MPAHSWADREQGRRSPSRSSWWPWPASLPGCATQDLSENLFGFPLPDRIAYPPFPAVGGPAGWFNVPALLITLLVTWVLVRGVRESARTHTTMVAIKMGAILIFCLGAAGAIQPGNWRPFAP